MIRLSCGVQSSRGRAGLVTYASREYGVHSLGITLSQKQVEFAAERIRQMGLTQSCQVCAVDGLS